MCNFLEDLRLNNGRLNVLESKVSLVHRIRVLISFSALNGGKLILSKFEIIIGLIVEIALLINSSIIMHEIHIFGGYLLLNDETHKLIDRVTRLY